MIQSILMVALSIMVISIAICAWRLVKGPSLPDRVAALDTIGINLLAMVAVLSVLFKTQAYIEYILLIGILSFIGTMALARYIERGWCLNMDLIKTVIEYVFVLLILTGALLSAVSSVGLIRLPDVYLRSHAAAKVLRSVCSVYSAAHSSISPSSSISSVRSCCSESCSYS